ncbi:MAG: putative beta-lysine N-acetyltransferase [Bradymonadia bacterium]|jgi:putative beta-lysine N-acetyltransferase
MNTITITSSQEPIRVVDDPFSDRVRCDHPRCDDGAKLGHALKRLADKTGRGRVVALVPASLALGLAAAGYEMDGLIPGFYEGIEDCAVMGLATDLERSELANPREVSRVDSLIDDAPPAKQRETVKTVRATEADAEAIADLLGRIFTEYPTPSSDPDYVRAQIREGVPFRLVHDDGDLVACASADLVRHAKTAELTDCATEPSHRGHGYMQFILSDLIRDVRELGYPTVFTLARARIAGVNLAFQRLGFQHRGCMNQSCRIGVGIEDMNIWSRRTVLD